jgi:hypothetical protein
METPHSIQVARFGRVGLRVTVRGVRSLAATIAYWEAIVARIAEDPPKWLLVIDELRGQELSASEWEQLVDRMLGRGLETVRIAHVKVFGLDHVEYCELYANAAGLETRAFAHEPEAERWLRYGDARLTGAMPGGRPG